MMFSYLDDKNFVDFVIEKGSIPFVVRGSISCFSNFNFRPYVGVEISRPTYRVGVFGENRKESDDFIKINVRELVDEVVFPGEIELPERTIQGVSKALYNLELWADFLCISVGNPKVVIEVQRPLEAIISTGINFDYSSLQRWEQLTTNYFKLAPEEQKKVASVLWWYRKASSTAYYSLFDSYTAYWNCLEILCGVSADKPKKEGKVDNQINDYLKGKEKITAGHIFDCYHKFVRYSIKDQMKDALKDLTGEEQSIQITYQCFEIKPDKDRLYQIRNDINHGNIRENSISDYERVYFRNELLRNIVMELLHKKVGHPISFGMSVNEMAEKLANPAFRKGES